MDIIMMEYKQISSTDAEKPFDKIWCPFMLNTLNKLGLEENYLHFIKATYNNSTTNIILSGKRM